MGKAPPELLSPHAVPVLSPSGSGGVRCFETIRGLPPCSSRGASLAGPAEDLTTLICLETLTRSVLEIRPKKGQDKSTDGQASLCTYNGR